MGTQASEEGLLIVDKARRTKGWTKSDRVWCDAAYVAQPTLRRFWKREKIQAENFKAICRAIGCDWQDVAEHTPDKSGICYIRRPPIETQCHAEIRTDGSLIRIKASAGMGKTALISEISDAANRLDYQVLRLNMLRINDAVIDQPDQVLKWVCRNIYRQLNLCTCKRVEEFWDDDDGSNDNCTAYLEEQVLSHIKKPVVLLIDNLDRIFPHQQTAIDLLGLLRSWYEEARCSSIWQKLRIVLAHSTDLYLNLSVVSSPFNVGKPISLPEFSQEQVQSMLMWHEIPWTEEEVNELMDIVGGHPELISNAIHYAKIHPELDFQGLIESIATPNGPYRNHLQNLSSQLQDQENLSLQIQSLLSSNSFVVIPPNDAFYLDSLGLIILHKNSAKIRNRLYRQYFQQQFSAKTSMPV